MSDPVLPGEGTPVPPSDQPQQYTQPLQEFTPPPPYGQVPEQYAQPQYAQPQYAQPQEYLQAPQQQPHPVQPPPHPYAVAPTQPAPGRGLAITAMATGLAALVTTLVAVLYLKLALVLAAGLAVAAIVLGVMALVKGGGRATAITGVASGAVSIITVVMTVAFGLGALGFMSLQGGPGAFEDGDTSSSEESPSDAQVDVQWPANLSSGGIMFTGQPDGSISVVESDALPDNSFPDAPELPTAADGSTPDHIQLYVDYRCPACLAFEVANGETLEHAAQAGAVVEIKPLTFLDSSDPGGYYSSRVAGAMACVAENQPDLAWDAHVAFLNSDFQPSGGPSPDNEQIVDRLDAAAGTLNSAARTCIVEEQHVYFSQALSNWSSTNPVPRAEDPDLMVRGTPLALVNGVQFNGDITDSKAFASFVTEQGVTLK